MRDALQMLLGGEIRGNGTVQLLSVAEGSSDLNEVGTRDSRFDQMCSRRAVKSGL